MSQAEGYQKCKCPGTNSAFETKSLSVAGSETEDGKAGGDGDKQVTRDQIIHSLWIIIR